jgi:hypothetical protein
MGLCHWLSIPDPCTPLQNKLQEELLAHEKPSSPVPATGPEYWGALPHPLEFSLAAHFGGRARPSMDEMIELSKKVGVTLFCPSSTIQCSPPFQALPLLP